MNPELNKAIIEMIKAEAMELIKNYNWKWSEENMCYYNEHGDDVADCVYYDCTGFLIHPKILATYVEDCLRFGRDKMNIEIDEDLLEHHPIKQMKDYM